MGNEKGNNDYVVIDITYTKKKGETEKGMGSLVWMLLCINMQFRNGWVSCPPFLFSFFFQSVSWISLAGSTVSVLGDVSPKSQ